MVVTVYCVPASAEGTKVRGYFESKGIGYREIDVSAEPGALQKLSEISGQTDRLAIVVNEQVFVGFDPDKLDMSVPSRY